MLKNNTEFDSLEHKICWFLHWICFHEHFYLFFVERNKDIKYQHCPNFFYPNTIYKFIMHLPCKNVF